MNYAQRKTALTLPAVLNSTVDVRQFSLEPEMIVWAERNKVGPFLAQKLSVLDTLDSELRDWARDQFEFYKARNHAILIELSSIFGEFDRQGVVGVVVVENFGTLVERGSCLAGFGSGDVDLMAHRADQVPIEQALAKNGWSKAVRRNVPGDIMTTFKKNIADDAFYLNLEWKFVSRKFFAREMELASRLEYFRSGEFIRRVSGINVLKADANFYVNCMHLSIGHYFGTSPGLRLYKDLEPYLKDPGFSIDRAWSWARQDGTNLRLEVCLQLYKDLFERSYKVPMTVSEKAERLGRYVVSLNNHHEMNNFCLWQQIKIDSMAEGMSLPGYLFRRSAATMRRLLYV